MAVAVTYNKCCVFNRFASETGTVIPGTAVVHLTAVSLVKPPCGGYRNKKWNCHLDPEAVEVKSPLRFLIFYDASTVLHVTRNTQHPHCCYLSVLIIIKQAAPLLLLLSCYSFGRHHTQTHRINRKGFQGRGGGRGCIIDAAVWSFKSVSSQAPAWGTTHRIKWPRPSSSSGRVVTLAGTVCV